ncbi:hypothetical protein COLO4_34828 [Corchorus olitorius]|uniref:Uncharacterized protein n=1 Tax=Corchorus olitorius TaxID=93759 RepID=A0A1R3GJF8_9ROSI|nr:hypothetical protein COLO4_34828 [Corchorus olitorius]
MTWWNKKAARQQARQAEKKLLRRLLLTNQLENAKPPIDSWRTILIDLAKEGIKLGVQKSITYFMVGIGVGSGFFWNGLFKRLGLSRAPEIATEWQSATEVWNKHREALDKKMA